MASFKYYCNSCGYAGNTQILINAHLKLCRNDKEKRLAKYRNEYKADKEWFTMIVMNNAKVSIESIDKKYKKMHEAIIKLFYILVVDDKNSDDTLSLRAEYLDTMNELYSNAISIQTMNGMNKAKISHYLDADEKVSSYDDSDTMSVTTADTSVTESTQYTTSTEISEEPEEKILQKPEEFKQPSLRQLLHQKRMQNVLNPA